MPSLPNRIRQQPLAYGYLLPFAAVAVYGLIGWWSWTAGNVRFVQPRAYDAALPANACVCFILLGLTPGALVLGWQRAGLALASIATLLAWGTLIQGPLGLDFGLDDLLVRHDTVVAGPGVARMPVALASVLLFSGLLLVWLAARPRDTRRPLLLALLGSLCAGYGLTGLAAYRTGLNGVDFWVNYARLGPHTAVLLITLGAAQIWLAARDNPDHLGAGPRWLWLPVVACSLTVTITFWIALREREVGYTNSTTQLTINNIAALFSGETETSIDSLARQTTRWARAPGLTRADWEADVTEYLRDFTSYRSIQWVDATLRTRWFWPRAGNEEAASFDHAGDPLRHAAIETARSTYVSAVAAPLETPLQSPTFAAYIPTSPVGATAGFVAGEFYYDKIFDQIDRRLNLSRRYHLTVSVAHPAPAPGAKNLVKVYESMTPDEVLDGRLRQSATYNLLNQRLNITLNPRPVFFATNRQYLPEITLGAGLGVSLLFGLVINLAQSARLRQRAAEFTSGQLRKENEERRSAEARLKTADERLNLAFDSTQVGVYEWNVETDAVYCTPSIWKLIGYNPADMPSTGQGWLGLLHGEDLPAVRAVIDAHFRGETPFIDIEHCVVHESGEPLWIALRAKCTSFSASKAPRRVLGTIQNINARKRADEALRASQAESRKLSLVASKTDNAVIITDPLGHIEWANSSYTRLTGRRLAEVHGDPLVGLLASPDSDPGALDRISAALAAHEPVTIDAIQLATEDRRFHVHLDMQPVLNDEGYVENFIAIETDITARVEIEQQLRRAKAEADAVSRAKSDFLATMSHEIRTPMNGVIGMTSLLLETDLTAEQRDYVSTIRTSGDSLLTIINEILDFSKIESGKMELERQPFEVAQCVEEAIDLFTVAAAAKGVELAYVIDPRVPACVLGDINRLRQILVNLMNNAVKFTPRGFVTLEVTADPATVGRPADEKILLDFYVTDSGIGIPADRMGLLFKPFSQVDASTTRRYGGTGLGLAICDRLTQLMGGSIDVTSVPDQGSRFHFCIQTSVVDVTDDATPALFTALPAGCAVLAVDDHPVNRTALANYLASWKIRPLLAADAATALTQAATTTLSAAIIDQDLPGRSGLDLVADLRARHPSLPILLLTPAAATTRRPETGDPLVHHLPKPLKPYPLHDILRRIISGPGPHEPSTTNSGIAVRLADTIPLDILLAEDNPVNQKVVLRYLDLMGYRADAVGNGLEAVHALRERNYHLVFMDVQMPEMDGLQATHRIRSIISPERQPCIVALTANAMQGDRERCLAAGMNDYLSKPVKIDDIQGVISRHFGPKST
ncbi:MAG: response regulator [Opitutae bacterium]|nr:response regulator [Opitutae bacterium]